MNDTQAHSAGDNAAEGQAARPLFGRRVLLTRTPSQAMPLYNCLIDLGAEVLLQPAIIISDPPDWQPVDAVLARLAEFDWLVFSSANGVRYLLERLVATGGDLHRLGKLRLAAIGPGTAEELARYQLRADLIPEQFRAESLAESLLEQTTATRFLLARASRGREVLCEQLTAAGRQVEQVVVYSSRDVETADPQIVALMEAGRIDWVTVTSSAIAHSLASLFGPRLNRSRLASISPLTSGVLRQLGFEPAVEATRYTMDGLIEAMIAGQGKAV